MADHSVDLAGLELAQRRAAMPEVDQRGRIQHESGGLAAAQRVHDATPKKRAPARRTCGASAGTGGADGARVEVCAVMASPDESETLPAYGRETARDFGIA